MANANKHHIQYFFIIATIVLVVMFYICRQVGKVVVTVSSSSTSEEITNLALIVGIQKCWDGQLIAGSSLVCKFDPALPGEVWLSYQQGAHRRHFNGPTLRQNDGGGSNNEILQHVDGLRLFILIEPDGQVKMQKCYWPCIL